jgi:hypothetical protein
MAQSTGGRPFCHGLGRPITEALSIALGGGWSTGRLPLCGLNLKWLLDGFAEDAV